jgi:nodulation protein E
MTSNSAYRVAVTGIGSISSLGHNADEIWKALEAGKSGIGPVTRADPDKLHVGKIAAEVKDYDESQHFEESELLLLDRYTQFALHAAREAIEGSGIDFERDGLGGETASIVASGIGGWDTIDTAYSRLMVEKKPRVHPFTVPRMMISAAASQVSMKYGLRGPTFCVSSACSSANHAMGEAYWMVRTGRARAAVAGGAEAEITHTSQRAWESIRVMAPDTCRPFSKGRRGMVIGEGAGMIVMERLEDAQARGADILAEIVGYGLSADAGDIVMPDKDGAAKALRLALESGGLNPGDIDYINAHGTGTQQNDVTETAAIRQVFGDHADSLAVSSTKSMHGHALGAAGALEMVVTIKAMNEGVLPQTANYQEPDPACDLDYVPNEPRDATIRAAVSNSFAFGGLNAVIALKAAP